MESQKVNVQLKELFENVFGGGGGNTLNRFFPRVTKEDTTSQAADMQPGRENNEETNHLKHF